MKMIFAIQGRVIEDTSLFVRILVLIFTTIDKICLSG